MLPYNHAYNKTINNNIIKNVYIDLYFQQVHLHFPAQSSSWLYRYYLNWTELDNAITKFNNEMHSADNWVLNFTLLTQFAYFDIVQCFVTICIVKSAI